MHRAKIGATHYRAQLRLLDKGRVIEELFVCWVLLKLIPRMFGQKRRDLAPLSDPMLLNLTLRCLGQPPIVRRGN